MTTQMSWGRHARAWGTFPWYILAQWRAKEEGIHVTQRLLHNPLACHAKIKETFCYLFKCVYLSKNVIWYNAGFLHLWGILEQSNLYTHGRAVCVTYLSLLYITRRGTLPTSPVPWHTSQWQWMFAWETVFWNYSLLHGVSEYTGFLSHKNCCSSQHGSVPLPATTFQWMHNEEGRTKNATAS